MTACFFGFAERAGQRGRGGAKRPVPVARSRSYSRAALDQATTRPHAVAPKICTGGRPHEAVPGRLPLLARSPDILCL